MSTSLTHENVKNYLREEWRTNFRIPHSDFMISAEQQAAIIVLFSPRRPGDITPPDVMARCYDTLAPVMEALGMADPIYEAERITFIAEQIETSGAKRVVDAGCGVGIQLGLLAHTFPKVEFVGYDISRVCTERAKERIKRLKCPNVRIYSGDHLDAPSLIDRPHDFDLVWALGSFSSSSEMLPTMRIMSDIAEWSRVKRTDQVLIRRTKMFAAMVELLRKDGRFLEINPNEEGAALAMMMLSRTAGLRREEHWMRVFKHGMDKTAHRLAAGMLGNPVTEATVYFKN